MDGELVPPEAEKGFKSKPLGRLQKAYKLQGRRKWQGLDVSIENRRGSVRRWYDPHAKRHGETKMHHAYGYIRMTEGVDGDHVDVYLGPDESADKVYVVHQMKAPKFEKFDEDKCMLNFPSKEAAKRAYVRQYDDPRFLGSITTMSVTDFVEKVTATRNKPARKRMLKSLVDHGRSLLKATMQGQALQGVHHTRGVGSGAWGVHKDEKKKLRRGVSTLLDIQNLMDVIEDMLRDKKDRPKRLVLDIRKLDPSLFEALGGNTWIHKDPWQTVKGDALKQNVKANRERTDQKARDNAEAQKVGRMATRWSPYIDD
jgi:hypothetical protein